MQILKDIKPLKTTEDIADFSLYYLLREKTFLAYYSPPKSSWTELRINHGNNQYMRYIGRDELRANIVMQINTDKNRFLVCEGKESINEVLSSRMGGFEGELTRMKNFFKSGVVEANYEIVLEKGDYASWEKKVPYPDPQNIINNACFCFNLCLPIGGNIDNDYALLSQKINSLDVQNSFGIIFYWDYTEYKTRIRIFVKDSTDDYWKNFIKNIT